MKALVFVGDQGVKHKTVDDPTLADDKAAIVKVTHCSICGSDIQFYEGINNASADTGFCVGHEGVGEIVELGSDVKGRKIGDKVMLPGLLTNTCGNCDMCKAGKARYCRMPKLAVYGNGLALHGSQAEAVMVPDADTNAALTPEGISHEQAVLLTDTLPTAYLGCKNADITPGGGVAVVGLGPIGLMAVELSFTMGAESVYAIDPIGYRRGLAADLGATVTTPDTAFETITEQTKGLMVNSVVNTVGNAASIEMSALIAAYHATISCVGISHSPNVQYPQILSVVKSLTFRSALSYVRDTLPDLVPMLQKELIKPERVFSHRMSLDDGEKAYEMFVERLDNTNKILITP